MRTKLLALAILVGVNGSIAAQGISGIQDCDRALIVSTYNRTDQQFIDYRMAEQVDQQAYEEVRRSAGANATIYGVPMGANWGDFRQNIQRYRQSASVSFSVNTFRNVAWTGLGANSLAAYNHCLDTVAILEKRGVRLLILRVTERDVIIKVKYNPQIPSAPSMLPLNWSYTGGTQLNLPSEIPSAGEYLVIVPRPGPGREDTLLVNTSAGAADIGVTGLPLPSPPPTRCEMTSPPSPVPQLRPNGGQVAWRCSRLAAGNYRVNVAVTPSLVGTPPIRANYSISWMGKDGKGGSLGSGTIDVGVSVGVPNTANGTGSITIPEGFVDVIFTTGAMFSHLDFQNGNFGLISPSNLNLLIEQ